MKKEIERKWRASRLPDTQRKWSDKGYAIKQGYLAIELLKQEVRIRQAGDKFTLTVKSGDLLCRDETEIVLTELQFNDLWPITEGRRIEKFRYEVSVEEYIAEVDIYLGRVAALKIVEVEFPSVEEAKKFKAPDWFGIEVTNDARYKNQAIAQL